MFRFQEDDEVVLKDGKDYSQFLRAGSRGVIFCQYATTPPAYEVTFEGVDGKPFGGIFYEGEIEALQKAQPSVERETAAVN